MLLNLIVLVLALAPTGIAPPTRMTLKNGTVYLLKDPPRISGGRVVFTTADGKVYSLPEAEVLSIGTVPAPTPTARRLNPQDSRELGAIARQQRARRGKTAEVAPRSEATPRSARKGKTPPRTPSPHR